MLFPLLFSAMLIYSGVLTFFVLTATPSARIILFKVLRWFSPIYLIVFIIFLAEVGVDTLGYDKLSWEIKLWWVSSLLLAGLTLVNPRFHLLAAVALLYFLSYAELREMVRLGTTRMGAAMMGWKITGTPYKAVRKSVKGGASLAWETTSGPVWKYLNRNASNGSKRKY